MVEPDSADDVWRARAFVAAALSACQFAEGYPTGRNGSMNKPPNESARGRQGDRSIAIPRTGRREGGTEGTTQDFSCKTGLPRIPQTTPIHCMEMWKWLGKSILERLTYAASVYTLSLTNPSRLSLDRRTRTGAFFPGRPYGTVQ